MLEKLYQMVDGQVLTEDVKTSIEEAFNSAVEVKAGLLVESRIADAQTAMKEELQEKTAKLNEAAEEYRKQAESELEAKKNELDEEFKKKLADMNDKADKYIDEKLTETEHNLDNYTKFLANKLVESNRETNERVIKDLKSEAMYESLRRFAKIAGRDLATDLDESQANLIAEHKDEVNKLIEENNDLRQKNSELHNKLVFEDITKDLSISQKDRMAHASRALMECNDPDIRSKLVALKESFATSYNKTERPADSLRYDSLKPENKTRDVLDMLFKKI